MIDKFTETVDEAKVIIDAAGVEITPARVGRVVEQLVREHVGQFMGDHFDINKKKYAEGRPIRWDCTPPTSADWLFARFCAWCNKK